MVTLMMVLPVMQEDMKQDRERPWIKLDLKWLFRTEYCFNASVIILTKYLPLISLQAEFPFLVCKWLRTIPAQDKLPR